jgi:ApbE superfamily uncharacterized protein (UPF0280 family)
MAAARARLSNGRWHFQHGPIDLVIGADGPAADAAHEAAWLRFVTVLEELVSELPLLRKPVLHDCPLRGTVARRMWHACAPFAAGFITPMAAVAGSVAQEIVAAYERPGVARAWVNNGGDIALHLAPGESVRVGIVGDLADVGIDGRFTVDAASPVRGIATSGWRGRSFSLGIADSVTVLARSAAMADAAATVIANAVNVDHPLIARRPANELKDDSDLGARLVTVDVPPLPRGLLDEALENGMVRARELQQHGLIESAVLQGQGRMLALQPRTAPCTALATEAIT